MRFVVTVLHNVSNDMFLRFRPETSKLYHAHTFEVVADNVPQAAELVFTLANVDGAEDLPPHLTFYGTEVARYRQRMNRSLSVSDVLIFHEDDPRETLMGGEPRLAGVLAVAPIGHEVLEEVPHYVDGSNETPTSQSYRAHATWRSR